MVKVYLERESKTKYVEAKTARELLKKLKIPEGTVLVIRNNEIITEDTKLKKDNKVRLLPVISGG